MAENLFDLWDNRVMFERYLYDYLKKKNMHDTAEIFRRETEIPIDPATPPSIDIPDGFLQEWWLMFYDMFLSRQLNNQESMEAGSMTAGKSMTPGQHSNVIPVDHYEANEQKIRNLTLSTESGTLVPGENPLSPWNLPLERDQRMLFPSRCEQSSPKSTSRALYQQSVPIPPSASVFPRGNLFNLIAQEVGFTVNPQLSLDGVVPDERKEEMLHLFSSSRYQQGLQPSIPTAKYFPGDLSILNAQGVGSSVCKTINIEDLQKKDQSGRKGASSSYSPTGSQSTPDVSDSPSETSVWLHTSLDCNAMPSSSHACENDSNTSPSVSNLQKSRAAPKRRSSKSAQPFTIEVT